MKEFQLVGTVIKRKGRWVIPDPNNPHPIAQARIIPCCTHHGTRVSHVTLSGMQRVIEALRNSVEANPSKKSRLRKPMSPIKFFEMLGKLTRGEIEY